LYTVRGCPADNGQEELRRITGLNGPRRLRVKTERSDTRKTVNRRLRTPVSELDGEPVVDLKHTSLQHISLIYTTLSTEILLLAAFRAVSLEIHQQAPNMGSL